MPFAISIGDLRDVSDQAELERLLRKHSARLARVPLSAWPWEQLPKEAPPGWEATSYIAGLYALTYWVLNTDTHPLGSLLTEYIKAKESGVDTRQHWPELSQYESRIRGWLACGRIEESSLDDLCTAMRLPPMLLFDERAWIAPPSYSNLERQFRGASQQELVEIFADFADDQEPAPEWKKEAFASALAYDRSRPDRLKVGELKLRRGLKQTTTADDKIIAFLVRANQARGGSAAHRRSLHARVLRQSIKIQESVAWYRLNQVMRNRAES